MSSMRFHIGRYRIPHFAEQDRRIYMWNDIGEELLEYIEDRADRVWEESEIFHYGFEVDVFAEFDTQKYAVFLQLKFPTVKYIDLTQRKNGPEQS